MQVALIANRACLDEGVGGFRHLVVGLLDEQVRVVQVLPEGLGDKAGSGFGERVGWRDSGWSWLRGYRLAGLAEELDKLGVDLIHGLDHGVWQGAVKLGVRLNVPVVLSASGGSDVSGVAGVGRIGGLEEGGALAYLAATQAVGEAIREQVGNSVLVEVVATGVHVSEDAGFARCAGGALCAVVSGNGKYDADYDALLRAMRQVTEEYGDCQFFFDGQGGDQHGLWQAGKGYGLLANMSLLPRRLGHQEMLLRADVLIQPQALGRSRSLTLEAMAQGLVVVARRDRWLDYLIDGQTAWVVEESDAGVWVGLIERLINHPGEGAGLAKKAKQWVGENHLASAQVAKALSVYRRLTSESIKFPQGS